MNVRSKKFTLLYFITAGVLTITFWWAVGLWDGNKVIDPPEWARKVIGYSFLVVNFHAFFMAWEVWVKPKMEKDKTK